MSSDTGENTGSLSLAEQFRSKGYQCDEVKDDASTVLIITHARKKEEAAQPPAPIHPGKESVSPGTQALTP